MQKGTCVNNYHKAHLPQLVFLISQLCYKYNKGPSNKLLKVERPNIEQQIETLNHGKPVTLICDMLFKSKILF